MFDHLDFYLWSFNRNGRLEANPWTSDRINILKFFFFTFVLDLDHTHLFYVGRE